ncbi:hypothetical protein EV368DRAFT_61184 [Lentinula lateritia]|uniref:Uncharacterized protein n=1 Tax=Lentinula aff. lateritia TaxID=2804960 RepID=A0ACC1UD00_9AGAR|nr:hypothetical protein F5876DRAFT_61944 [Lentinula aff. lateritia]KAJ3857060.1 hypothetical protein EV368DRAFT_61184 [Lentinula lateritia]
MTESYISPSDIAQYHGSQDRVRNWITAHADHVFTSPNIPPSELDDQDALSSPPSDVESSHSVPPRLKLQYPDGRESPIPHTTNSSSSTGRNSRSRSNPQPNSSRQRSKLATAPSSSPILISDPRREREKLRSHSPEEIQIFPSASDEIPPVPLSSHHSRSRSLPRDAFSPSRNHDPMPNSSYGATPGMQMQTEMSPPVIPLLQSPGPYAGFARTQPAPTPWHPYTNAVRTGPMMPPSREHFKHNPPSIIYAPSNNSRTNYHPPAILSYRPTAGPNRIFYSHSVPPAQAQIANAVMPHRKKESTTISDRQSCGILLHIIETEVSVVRRVAKVVRVKTPLQEDTDVIDPALYLSNRNIHPIHPQNTIGIPIIIVRVPHPQRAAMVRAVHITFSQLRGKRFMFCILFILDVLAFTGYALYCNYHDTISYDSHFAHWEY